MKKLLNMKKLLYIALMIAAGGSVGCKTDLYSVSDVTGTSIIRVTAQNTVEILDNEDGTQYVNWSYDGDTVEQFTFTEDDNVPQYYNYYYETNELYLFTSSYVISDYYQTTPVDGCPTIVNYKFSDYMMPDNDYNYTRFDCTFERYEDKPWTGANFYEPCVVKDGKKFVGILDENGELMFDDIDGNSTHDTDYEDYICVQYKMTYQMRAETVVLDPDITAIGEYSAKSGFEAGAVQIRRLLDENLNPVTFENSKIFLYAPANSGISMEDDIRYID